MNNTFKVPNAFYSGLKAVGLDPAMVLRKGGLPLNLGSSGKSMVSTEQWFDLWNAASELSGDLIVFRLNDLDMPFATYNAELLEMLSSGVDKALAAQEQRDSTAAGQIRWVLRRYLGGRQPDISDVARELGMSSRTLQRRIADEGTNFRRILNQERHELAKHYLPQPALELNEVAYLLGYEDPNSFIRAFREWEGTTPGEWKSARQRSLVRS